MSLKPLAILILFSPILAIATADNVTLEHFKAGNYQLVQGLKDKCGLSPIGLREEKGQGYFDLGFHHFILDSNAVKLDSDIPGETNCNTEFKPSVSVKAKQTIVKFIDIKSCDNKVKYEITKTAEIEGDQIKLTVQQTGEDAEQYTCTWKLSGH